MVDHGSSRATRRLFLTRLAAGGLALTAMPLALACGSQPSAPAGKPAEPAKPADAKPAGAPAAPAAAPAATAPAAAQSAPARAQAGPDPALIEASKKEGKLVWYSPVVEEDKVKHLEAFKAKHPWVDVKEYLRLQTGKLYPKVVEEVSQNVQSCDVLTLSEIALSLDFQKKGFWGEYKSTESGAFDKKWKSQPEGFWVGNWINIAGIAWNTNLVKPDEAPKGWKDLLDPKWKKQINMKDSASGLQYGQYAMIAKLYGESFWDEFAKNQPVGLAGTAQQYETLISGEFKLNGLAQQSTWVQKKKAGAPVEIVFPKDGIPFTSLMHGIVKNAPHPATARLFIDWLLGPEGSEAIAKVSQDYVTRPDAPSPDLIPKFSELNVWFPEDWEKYVADQPAWRDKWNKITGV
ncbi:MAG: extracellular solute-binding protein [Chloroflexota bacterium]